MRERRFPCKKCGETVTSWGRDTECPTCDTPYNAFGQELRPNWWLNRSNYDDDVSDMDGYEEEMIRYEESA